MVCVHCSQKTSVINSRPQKRLNQVWRRRRCDSCKAIFSTQEVTDYALTWAVEGPNGRLRPFSRDKLFLSLYDSCQHRKNALSDASALTDTVIKKLLAHTTDGTLGSNTITQIAQVALNRFDSAASVRYAAFHGAASS